MWRFDQDKVCAQAAQRSPMEYVTIFRKKKGDDDVESQGKSRRKERELAFLVNAFTTDATTTVLLYLRRPEKRRPTRSKSYKLNCLARRARLTVQKEQAYELSKRQGPRRRVRRGSAAESARFALSPSARFASRRNILGSFIR